VRVLRFRRTDVIPLCLFRDLQHKVLLRVVGISSIVERFAPWVTLLHNVEFRLGAAAILA